MAETDEISISRGTRETLTFRNADEANQFALNEQSFWSWLSDDVRSSNGAINGAINLYRRPWVDSLLTYITQWEAGDSDQCNG
jgi:hypothetical protein